MTPARKKLLYIDLILGFSALLIYPALMRFCFGNISGHKVITSISFLDIVKSRLGFEIFRYLSVLVICHLSAFLMVWWISCTILNNFRSARSFLLAGTCLMTFFIWWCYAANAFFYPNSSCAIVAEPLLDWRFGSFFLLFSTIAIGTIVISSIWLTLRSMNLNRIRKLPDLSRIPSAALLFGVMIVAFALILPVRAIFADFGNHAEPSVESYTNEKTPDVILLGIDSLRPDFLPLESGLADIPNIRGFVKHSIQFETAYTPLARTYPAWNSILTGTYPRKNGAMFNLVDDRYRNMDMVTLATRLKGAGYEAVYATDEKRFSNIDESFGFDRILGPPMGAADFLLGTFNDFPVSNLLVNTAIGKMLFPYSYANRAASVTYDPNTFVSLIRQDLPDKGEQPSFLCIHLCLPHWPYTWRSSDISTTNDIASDEMRYSKALDIVDRQFGRLLDILRDKGYLENAMVVLLSDHGEGLSTDNYNLTSSDNDSRDLFGETYGHGTDVLNRKQYEVLLAYRGFGRQTMTPGVVKQTAGLIDIAPTISDLLGMPSDRHFEYDGISLRPWIEDINAKSYSRSFFVETGFSIPSIVSKTPNMAEAFSEGHAHYRVPSNGRVVIKDESMPLLISQKHYAVYSGDWSYIRMPRKNGDGYREIVVDNRSGKYFDADGNLGRDFLNMRIALNDYVKVNVN